MNHPSPLGPPSLLHTHTHTHTRTCTQLMVTIGNDCANTFWEHHYHGDRLPADMEREIRENFIRAKYQVKSWIPTHTGEGRDNLSQLLCISVKTNNLMRTLELLVRGADVSFNLESCQVALHHTQVTLPSHLTLLFLCSHAILYQM